jgi:rod shape-determining protein MreC
MATQRNRGRRVWVVSGTIAALIAALLLVLRVVEREDSGPLGGVRSFADDSMEWLAQLVAQPTKGARDVTDQALASWQTAERIRELEAEVKQLQEWRILALSLNDRIKKLEGLLSIDASSLSYVVSAQVTLDPGGPFARAALINAGSAQGVGRDFIAMNERGLVGRVTNVGERSARVLLLDDPQSRVPVVGERSRTRSMLGGGGALRATLEGYGDRPILDGERLFTTGEAGIYPRGLLVGTVRMNGTVPRVDLAAPGDQVDFVRLAPPEVKPLPPTVIRTPVPERTSITEAQAGLAVTPMVAVPPPVTTPRPAARPRPAPRPQAPAAPAPTPAPAPAPAPAPTPASTGAPPQ